MKRVMYGPALQEDLKEKVRNLQSMKAELDMRHAQVDDYKFNIKQMQVGQNAAVVNSREFLKPCTESRARKFTIFYLKMASVNVSCLACRNPAS